MTRLRLCRSPLPLTRLQDPPETCLDHPYALPLAGVAVPFTVDDRFHSHSKVVAISLAARGLWVSAGAWSSDHRKGGVVPDRVLATLGSTPELEAELLATGLWRRVRRGIRFHDWEQWNDTAEMAAQKEAEAQRKRDMATLRQQNKREKDKAELAAKLARDVTQASRAMPDPVTQPRYKREKKPKVRGTPVTRDIGVTSRVTPGPSHARADFDLDFDFNQPAQDQVSQSGVINAGTREPEPGTPEFRLRVIAEFAEFAQTEIDDATADALAAEVLGKATDPVPNPLGYVLTSIAKERNPCGRWLPKRIASRPRPAARQPWCGKCDEIDRTRENDDGKLQRCPECSGLAPAWEAS